MIRQVLLGSLLALAFIFSGLSYAEANKKTGYYPSTEVLLKKCREAIKWHNRERYNAVDAGWCLGFIHGLYDAHNYYSARSLFMRYGRNELSRAEIGSKIKNHQIFCPSESGENMYKVLTVVVNYIQQNKKFMNEPAAITVYRALISTFPCQRAGSHIKLSN